MIENEQLMMKGVLKNDANEIIDNFQSEENHIKDQVKEFENAINTTTDIFENDDKILLHIKNLILNIRDRIF